MKNLFLIILIVTTSFGCSKNNPPVVTPLPTQWDFNGITHHGVSTKFNGDSLFSIDSLGESVAIIFNTPPSANSTYSVSNGQSGVHNSCEIILEGEKILNNPAPPFISTGYYSDRVTVSLSGGKISASFSTILLSNNIGSLSENTAYITGTLTQQ